MKRVLFQANWSPQYRFAFYDGLRDDLLLRGIQLDLTYGETPRKFRDRGDHQPLAWARRRTQWMPGTSTFELQFDPIHVGRTYDLVILEVIAKQVSAYAQMALHHLGVGPKIAFFGHGAVDRTPSRSVAQSIKRAVASAGVGWLVYTEQGREALDSYGVNLDSIHVLNNTIDASGLRAECESASKSQRDIRSRLGLGEGPVLLHIGGLDESKRLDLVFDAFDQVSDQVPDVQLVIAGSGSSSHEVAQVAATKSNVHYAGPVFGDSRAELFAVSDLLLHPGKVGLVVIDSFATGVPLVVARGQLQAPEFDYLTPDFAAFAASPDSGLVATEIIRLLEDRQRLAQLASAAHEQYRNYDMASMVRRAADGIEHFLVES